MSLATLAPYLAYGYVSWVGASSKIHWAGLEHLRFVENEKGFLYAFWHQRQLLFTYTHRSMPPHVLVSRSRDGEIIARLMDLSGIPAVRGSSSRGASSAAKELLTLLALGRNIGITPDGPRGPARQVKPGILFLAQKSGKPILPISNASSRFLSFSKAWDKFQVPLPFSKICICCGPPLWVKAQDDLNEKALELKARLDQITEFAENFVH